MLSSRAMLKCGYPSPEYVASLAEYGRPLPLPRSGGWLLVRPIPGSDAVDAMGPYPIFCCLAWTELGDDLTELGDRLVSIVVVMDPFAPGDTAALAVAFNRGVVHYKDHHVIDLNTPLDRSACEHHRRNARKSLARLQVEEVAEPSTLLETWCRLYDELICRHGITGVSRFSRKSFELQFSVPGLVAFRAVDDIGETVGMVLWYCQGEVGYYHLAAYSPRGYAGECLVRPLLDLGPAAAGPGPLAEPGRGAVRDVRWHGWADAVQTRLVATGPAGVSREARRVSTALCRALSGATGDRFLPGLPVQQRLDRRLCMARVTLFGLQRFAALAHPILKCAGEHGVVASSTTETALASQVLDTHSGTRRIKRRPGGVS